MFAYLAVFILSSWGARQIMRLRGYPMPSGFATKVDRLLAVMHLLWFIILTMLGFSLLLAFGVEPW